MKTMILAAGFGTRLFPLTIDRTKPAIPFLGKPLVGYVAEYLAGYGFRDIVVNLHHQPDSVIQALGDGSRFGVRIDYTIEQPNILGTAGALDNARHLLDGGTFLIVNGKIITDIDIAAAAKTHKRSGALATMVLKPNVKRERFTIVNTEGGYISGFAGMAQPLTEEEIRDTEHEIATPLMFTGILFVEPRIFDYIPRGVFSDTVSDVYKPAMARGEKIATFAPIARARVTIVATVNVGARSRRRPACRASRAMSSSHPAPRTSCPRSFMRSRPPNVRSAACRASASSSPASRCSCTSASR